METQYIKPFKGYILYWKRQKISGLGKMITDIRGEVQNIQDYYITGCPQGHPEFTGWIQTSMIVSEKECEEGIEVETLNSKYILLGPQLHGSEDFRNWKFDKDCPCVRCTEVRNNPYQHYYGWNKPID